MLYVDLNQISKSKKGHYCAVLQVSVMKLGQLPYTMTLNAFVMFQSNTCYTNSDMEIAPLPYAIVSEQKWK